jgi:hypothetical protein
MAATNMKTPPKEQIQRGALRAIYGGDVIRNDGSKPLMVFWGDQQKTLQPGESVTVGPFGFRLSGE